MMAICPECGKRHVVTWPDLNPFKRGDEYYCSSNCYEVSVNRDLSKIKEAALIRRQKKLMKYKKDGTPAKKPGRKPQKQIEIPAGEFKPAIDLSAPAKKVENPEGNMTVIATKEPPKVPTVKLDGALRIETPEAGKVEVVKEIPKKNALKYKVTGIETEVGEFWVVSNGKIKWIPGRLGKEDPVMQVMMTTTEPSLEPETWRRFAEIILEVIELLEVRP
jgi:endogenous inhibitor of DNA gyrase (YacG/DUF329 family)